MCKRESIKEEEERLKAEKPAKAGLLIKIAAWLLSNPWSILVLLIIIFSGLILMTNIENETADKLGAISIQLETYKEMLRSDPTPQDIVEIKAGLYKIELDLNAIEEGLK